MHYLVVVNNSENCYTGYVQYMEPTNYVIFACEPILLQLSWLRGSMETRRAYAFTLPRVVSPRRVLVVYKLQCTIKRIKRTLLLEKSSSEDVLHAVGESFNYEFPQQQDEHNRITNRSASSDIQKLFLS
jgi:hypothetical protein